MIPQPSATLSGTGGTSQDCFLTTRQRGDAGAAGNLVGVVVERGEQKCRWVAIIEVGDPAWLAAIGMSERLSEEIEIVREYQAARSARHMGFAIHRRERGKIAEISDQFAFVL